MKKRVYIPILTITLLLSSCYGKSIIEFNRVENSLFGKSDYYDVINRNMYDTFFFLADDQYYFHIDVSGNAAEARPGFLSLMDEAAERDYFIRAFRSEKTFANSSLSSDGVFILYRGDVTIAGTACATFYCAVYWLEDQRQNKVFVSVYSF